MKDKPHTASIREVKQISQSQRGAVRLLRRYTAPTIRTTPAHLVRGHDGLRTRSVHRGE